MRRVLTAAAVVLVAGTAVGLAVLWPGDVETKLSGSLGVDARDAKVTEVTETVCPGLGSQRCQLVTAELTEGRAAGRRIQLQLSATQGLDPDLDPGDDIRVTEAPAPPAGGQGIVGPQWSFYDFERGSPMLVLALAFCAIVLLFARLRGALSLLGLGLSLAVVLLFVVPAILDGEAPLAVAIVGSLAVALVTIPLAHGAGSKTLAALLGTAGSLLLTALLALVFTKATHLTGFSSEEATFLELGGARPVARRAVDRGHGDRGPGRARRRRRSARPRRCSRCARPTRACASVSCSRWPCASGATTSAPPSTRWCSPMSARRCRCC